MRASLAAAPASKSVACSTAEPRFCAEQRTRGLPQCRGLCAKINCIHILSPCYLPRTKRLPRLLNPTSFKWNDSAFVGVFRAMMAPLSPFLYLSLFLYVGAEMNNSRQSSTPNTVFCACYSFDDSKVCARNRIVPSLSVQCSLL